MADPREVKLAKILTDYSVTIKPGYVVQISFGPEAQSLALEVYKNVLKKGGLPRTHIDLPGFSTAFYRIANRKQLIAKPKIAMFETKNTDAWISIGTEYNTKELSNVDPKKISMRRKVSRPISDIVVNSDNWVILEYPTHALAQDADMSLEEFEDFVYGACIRDWKKEAKRQEKLMRLMDKTKTVRIKHKDTDLSFSIKGKKAVKCCGKRNMPDGEVFTEPVKHSVNGYIRYSFPAIYSGREVSGITLRFRKGKVVEAKAEKNEEFLKQMLKTDAGACYLGEFGVGVNYGIKKFIRQILFDEKIGGTIHLALGRAYKETGGENKSAVHWDMIKDLKNGGELYFDGKLVQKNGKFLFKF